MVAVDTHVHVYPFYDAGLLLRRLALNLSRAAEGREHVKAACLAERKDCSWFARLKSGDRKLPPGFELVEHEADPASLTLKFGRETLHLIAGRQLRTSEGLEVLALATVGMIADGLPASESIEAVRQAGGVPVLAWAPGKWSFKRAVVVRGIIANAAPGSLLVGDSSVRPRCLGEPGLMQEARKRGLTVIAGSDPLPAPGEELAAGSWCSLLECPFDESAPAASLRKALQSADVSAKSAGKRSLAGGMLFRQVRMRLWNAFLGLPFGRGTAPTAWHT